MDPDESGVIEILDSPVLPTGVKRKRDNDTVVGEDTSSRPAPKHPLLDSIGNRVQQNRAEREEKNAMFRTKREMEKVHSEYLKQNVADPQEMARASYAASHWAKKNGMKNASPKKQRSRTSPHKKRGGRKRGSRETGHNAADDQSERNCTLNYANLSDWPGTSGSEDSLATSNGRRSAHNLRYPSDEELDKRYICPILYCEAEFSSEGSLGQHMNLFQHSPCNPYRYAKDNKLLPDPLCYKCPECDIEFSTKQLCSNHMSEENHLVFYPPLTISAYLCPQCLYLFKTLETCWTHMEESRHQKISFPFKDDDLESDVNLPIAAAEEFVLDYVSKCKNVPFEVQCLDCGLNIPNPALYREHQDETNNVHVMSALTTSSLVDIFRTYVETFSCDTCHRLFSEQPGNDLRHICAGGIVGQVKADQIRTMSEFVKFCALSQIVSLKGKNPRIGNVKVGKVNHTKKHDPPKILDLQVDDRNGGSPDKFDTRILEIERGKDLNKESITRHSHTTRKTADQVKATNVKLENHDTVTFQSINSVGTGSKVDTLPVKSNANCTVSMLSEDQKKLNQTRPLKVEPEGESQTKNCTGRYREIKTIESPVKNNFRNLHKKEDSNHFKSKRKVDEDDERVSIREDCQPIPESSPSNANVQIPEYLVIEPSTSSAANDDDFFDVDLDDSDSDIEMWEEELSNGTIILSDCDEDKDESAVCGSKGETCKASRVCKGQQDSTDKKGKTGKAKKGLKGLCGKLCVTQRRNRRRIRIQLRKVEAELADLSKSPSKVKYLEKRRQELLEKEKRIKVESTMRELKIGTGTPKRAPSKQIRPGTSKPAPSGTSKPAPSGTSKPAPSKPNEPQTSKPAVSKQGMPALRIEVDLALKSQDEHLISTEYLKNMKNLVFLDFDNFPTFFKVVPQCPSEHMFVWAFYGGNTVINQNLLSGTYPEMRRKGLVYISERCGKTKDAADFALVLTVGKMDERLPPSVTFTIISADKGFCEVVRQMKQSTRSALLINPRQDRDILLPMLKSIVET